MTYAHPHRNSAVLVAVDLLEESARVIRRGIQWAEITNSPLVVLHVVHETAESAGLYHDWHKRTDTLPLTEIAGQMLQETVESTIENLGKTSLNVRHMIVQGLPGPRIAEVAELVGAAGIVMGEGKHSSWHRFWNGDVIDEVRKRTDRDLILVSTDTLGHSIPAFTESPEFIQARR